MSMPTSATTPAIPTSRPTKRVGVGRSEWSKRSASSATNIGTVAIRIAVREEEMRCSPKPISGQGMAISTIAKTTRGHSRRPRNAPSLIATGSSTAAASASRDQATKPGDISSTAILMKR